MFSSGERINPPSLLILQYILRLGGGGPLFIFSFSNPLFAFSVRWMEANFPSCPRPSPSPSFLSSPISPLFSQGRVSFSSAVHVYSSSTVQWGYAAKEEEEENVYMEEEELLIGWVMPSDHANMSERTDGGGRRWGERRKTTTGGRSLFSLTRNFQDGRERVYIPYTVERVYFGPGIALLGPRTKKVY